MSLATSPGTAVDQRRVARWGWLGVVHHQLRLMRLYLPTMLLTGIGSPFLYLLGLGLGLGVLVDGGSGIEGVDYIVFVAPALVMATAMQTAAQENTYGVFGGFKWSNIFTAMRLTPMSPGQMAFGFQVSTLLRVTPMLVFYCLAVMVFGLGHPLRVLLLIPIGLLLAFAVGFTVMAWVAGQKDDRGQLSFVERFVILPLTLFSGSYFPLETLPGYLQPIGWVSPLWHAAELGRVALYRAPVPGWQIAVHVAYLVALALVMGLVATRVFRRRLDQ